MRHKPAMGRNLPYVKDWLPLIGVVIAQFVIVSLYFGKQRADDRRRWHERRLDSYRVMAKAARDASAVFAQAEDQAELDDSRLVVALDAADSCSLDISMLATQEVREKAEAIHTLLEMAVVFRPGSDAFPTAVMFIEARNDFENAVRQELGVDRRRFTVEADSKTQLVWRALKTVLVVGYGSLGATVASRIEPRIVPNKMRRS